MNTKPNLFKIVIALFAAAIACLLFGGCSTLYDQHIVERPGEVVGTNFVLRTNIVLLEAARTNEVGEVIPARIAQVVQPEIVLQYAPPTYVTNLVPRATIETGIRAAGGLPVPWAGTAALLLGWAYSAFAAFRNKQIAKGLVQSVQVGREFLQATPEGQKLDAAFKEKLVRHQQFAGVAKHVQALLEAYVPNHISRKAA
jgi:hypothetical protein